MKLSLDVGNSQIYGGIFDDSGLQSRFRKITQRGASSDELGLFFRQVVRENGHDPAAVSAVGFCSVVPDLNHSLVNACRRYFDLEPFILRAGLKTGLKIRYKNPAEVGADRIACAVGAVDRYPGEDLVIIDFGTATTIEGVNAEREYLGGVIVPGLSISMRPRAKHRPPPQGGDHPSRPHLRAFDRREHPGRRLLGPLGGDPRDPGPARQGVLQSNHPGGRRDRRIRRSLRRGGDLQRRAPGPRSGRGAPRPGAQPMKIEKLKSKIHRATVTARPA